MVPGTFGCSKQIIKQSAGKEIMAVLDTNSCKNAAVAVVVITEHVLLCGSRERLCRTIVPLKSVDRIWGICGSYYKIPKAIFYLLKGDYT